MDLTLLQLHPPLPYGEWEWWWSKFMGREEVSTKVERRWSNPLQSRIRNRWPR
jgi:hypothetical protein